MSLQAFKEVIKLVWTTVGKTSTTISIGQAAKAVVVPLQYLEGKDDKDAALRYFTLKMRKPLHALVREAKSYLTHLILCATAHNTLHTCTPHLYSVPYPHPPIRASSPLYRSETFCLVFNIKPKVSVKNRPELAAQRKREH